MAFEALSTLSRVYLALVGLDRGGQGGWSAASRQQTRDALTEENCCSVGPSKDSSLWVTAGEYDQPATGREEEVRVTRLMGGGGMGGSNEGLWSLWWAVVEVSCQQCRSNENVLGYNDADTGGLAWSAPGAEGCKWQYRHSCRLCQSLDRQLPGLDTVLYLTEISHTARTTPPR